MLIEANHLETSGSTTDGSSFSTGSISPVSSRLLLVAVTSIAGSGAANIPTLTLTGWTFNSVRSVVFATSLRITLFSAIGSGSGSITFDFAGQTQTGCLWSISEFSNTKRTGTGGADGIVQSAEDSGDTGETGFAITLAAFSDVDNATYSCVAKNASNDVSSDFTELGEAGISTPTHRIQSQWKDSNDTSPDGTFVGSGGDGMGAIGVELAHQDPPPADVVDDFAFIF